MCVKASAYDSHRFCFSNIVFHELDDLTNNHLVLFWITSALITD